MRIDPNAKLPEVPDSKTLNRPGNSSRSVSPDRTAEADQATLAVQSRAQELQIRLHEMPEDRQSRIEALTRAVRDGEYKAGTEQIAQSLFAEMSARSVLLR